MPVPSWRETLRHIWPEIALGAALGITYLFSVPLWEAPDEPYHLANVAYVRKYGLYTLTHGQSELPQNLKAESSQPPLYYVIAATASRAFGRLRGLDFGTIEAANCWDEAWRFYNYGDTTLPRGIRGVSLLFLLVCGVLLGRACTLAFPADPHLPGTAMAMLWAVPQALFIGTSISNDSMAMAAGALLLVLWTAAWRSPSRVRFLLLGLAAPALLSVKFSLLPLVSMGICLAPALGSFRPGSRLVNALLYAMPGALAYAVLAAAAPEALDRMCHVVGARMQVQALKLRPMTTLPLAWESYWGRFGWMNVPVHDGVRLAFWSLSVTLAMGLGATAARFRAARAPMRIAGVAALASVIALVGDLPHSGQAQGRHAFPAIAALSLLGALGLRGYLSARAARLGAWLLGACGSLYVLGIVLPRAYGEEPSDLVLGQACCEGSQVTPSLAVGRGERQAFTSERFGLTRVGVVPATHGLPVRGSVVLTVIDRLTRESVASREFTGSEIRDGRFLYLDFPPVRLSREREYVIRVEPRGPIAGELCLFCSTRDVCPGTSRLNGPGDLRFATYHAPHEPETENTDED